MRLILKYIQQIPSCCCPLLPRSGGPCARAAGAWRYIINTRLPIAIHPLGNRCRKKLGKWFFRSDQSGIRRIETKTRASRLCRRVRGRDQCRRSDADIFARDVTLLAARQFYFAVAKRGTNQSHEHSLLERLVGSSCSGRPTTVKRRRFSRDGIELCTGCRRGSVWAEIIAARDQTNCSRADEPFSLPFHCPRLRSLRRSRADYL
jgi:hypothetical protein